jgi:hypothetical protein
MDEEQASLIVDEAYARLRAEAIERFASVPGALSGRSELATPWLEYAAQVQGQKSPLFQAYQDTLNTICFHLAAALNVEQVESMWPDSEGYLYWTHDGVPHVEQQRADVAEEITFRVRKEAMDLELPGN